MSDAMAPPASSKTRRAAAVLGFTLVATFGCSDKVVPASGELVLLVSSDMQVPDSFDTLVVSFASAPGERRVYTVSDSTKTRWENTEDEEDQGSERCLPQEGDTITTNLSLPSTLALLSSDDEESYTEMTFTLCQTHQQLLTKTLSVTLPARGEVLVQRLSLRWLCANKDASSVVGCYSCGSPRCYGQTISVDESVESPCSVAACDSDVGYPTEPYDSERVSYFHPDSSCFDVLGCFAPTRAQGPSSSELVPLRVDWLPSDGTTTEPCVAQLDSDSENLEQLNLALVLPPQTQGTCDETFCYVPLETNSTLGWTVDTADPSVLVLPDAVCHLLDSGQILSVVASRHCETKPDAVPICGTGNELTSSDEGETLYGAPLTQALLLYYKLDEAELDTDAYLDETLYSDLTYVSLTDDPSNLPSVDGREDLGRTFDSHHFGKSTLALPHAENFSLSLWIALTEAAQVTTSQQSYLPLLSSLPQDCGSGFRLGLEACGDGRVNLVFQEPTGKTDGGQCTLESTYAELTRQSWAGGYFSPWKRGDYRYVAVNHTADGEIGLYVDGLSSEATTQSCLANTLTTATPDDGSLYVGSNEDLGRVTAPVTGPLEFDEIRLFGRTLLAEEIRWLYAHPGTEIGPGGWRWGAWATQGSYAALTEVSPESASASIVDLAFSSAGLFAQLGENAPGGVPLLEPLSSLADYDEAVLWANPGGDAFQFAISAAHGQRQCTWTLQASDSPYYVINLRQPSWCTAPDCSFDVSQVEQVSIGSDWAAEESSHTTTEILALAFRKRLQTDAERSVGYPTLLGGLGGPGGFCWRAVSYQPGVLARLTRYSTESGISLEYVTATTTGNDPAELVADLPANDQSTGARDFRTCSTVRVCTPTTLPSLPLQFVLKNEVGQTATWDMAHRAGDPTLCYSADLDESGGTWPTSNEAGNGFAAPQDSDEVRATATRLSLRFGENFGVLSVECCDSSGENCEPLSATVPEPAAR